MGIEWQEIGYFTLLSGNNGHFIAQNGTDSREVCCNNPILQENS